MIASPNLSGRLGENDRKIGTQRRIDRRCRLAVVPKQVGVDTQGDVRLCVPEPLRDGDNIHAGIDQLRRMGITSKIGAFVGRLYSVLAVLDRMGYGHVTVHGFRATFGLAEECTDYPDGVREAALAHKYKSETTAAYQRGAKLEKRRTPMHDWAQFLLASSNATGLARGWNFVRHGAYR
ncbi:hypothetical protein [Bradyrhizobium sp. USDA 4454]